MKRDLPNWVLTIATIVGMVSGAVYGYGKLNQRMDETDRRLLTLEEVNRERADDVKFIRMWMEKHP